MHPPLIPRKGLSLFFLIAVILVGTLQSSDVTLYFGLLARADNTTGEAVVSLQAGIEIPIRALREEGESYRLDVTPGQYLQLRVLKEADALLSITCYRTDGAAILELPTSRYQDFPIMLIAETSGPYLLSIRPAEKAAVGKPYSLRVEISRSVTDDDRSAVRGAKSFAEAERLRGLWRESDLRAAIKSYSEALTEWQSSTKHHEATMALQSIGELHFMMSEYNQALDYFKKALENSQRHRDLAGEIESLNNIGYVHIYQSRYAEAIPYFKKALFINNYRKGHNPDNRRLRGHATSDNNLGEAHYSLGELKQALSLFNSALALWTEAGDRRGQALAYLNLGYTYYDMGDAQAASENYKKSLGLWSATNERRGEAQSRTALGGVYSLIGERQLALDYHDQAVSVFRRIGDRQGEAAALNGIGRVYEESNDPKTALDNYDHALKLCQAIGHHEFEAVAEYYVGRVQRSMGNQKPALEHYQRAIKLSRAVSNRRVEAYALKDISTIYSSQGDKDRAMALYRSVLNIYRSLGDRRGQAQTLNSIGETYDASGSKSSALHYFRKALSLNQAGADRVGEAATRYNIARTSRAFNQLTESLSQIRDSISIIESLRASLARYEMRYSYFALMQEYYAFYIDLLMQLHQKDSSAGFGAAALEASESTRARSLLEILLEAKAGIREGVSSDLLAREQSVQHQLAARARYRRRLMNSQGTESEARELEETIRNLSNEYSEIQSRIRAESPRYAALTQPKLPRTEQIQKTLLNDETVLLEYFLGSEKSYLWLVGNNSLETFELPKRAEIESTATKIYELLTARQPKAGETSADYRTRVADADKQYWQQASLLSDMLLGQLATRISGKRLLVVTDGALRYVPFEALPEPRAILNAERSETSIGITPKPLVLSHKVIHLPSASTLLSLRDEKPPAAVQDKIVAIFADPVFEKNDSRVKPLPGNDNSTPPKNADPVETSKRQLESSSVRWSEIPRLPSTQIESEAIMDVVPADQGTVANGFNANRERAMSADLLRYQVVHFATHGVIDDAHPELSGILLSMVNEQGVAENGFLQLHDIYNLRLSAKVVVLSACSTGLGKDVKGEGFIGLTRGFMYAGAQSTIASLWKVDDDATAELMSQFYKGLVQDGLSPDAALRSAKERMWKHPRWHEPFYWAAFVLEGEYEGALKTDNRGHSLGVKTIILTGIFVALAVAFIASRRFGIRLR